MTPDGEMPTNALYVLVLLLLENVACCSIDRLGFSTCISVASKITLVEEYNVLKQSGISVFTIALVGHSGIF